MFYANSASVPFAMQQEAIAEFVAVAPAGFHGGEHPVAFDALHHAFQAGRLVILGVYRQNKSEDDAISFLTGHVIHPVSRLRRSFYPRSMERVKGWQSQSFGGRSPPTSGIAD